MRTLRLAFSDFWSGFHAERWPVLRVLEEAFRLEICRDSSRSGLLMCGPYGTKHRSHRGTKVLYSAEAWPARRGEFDFTIGYDRLDNPSHLRLPVFAWLLMGDELDGRVSTKPDLSEWRARPNFCNFIYSDPGCPVRNEFFRVLSSRRHVVAPGKVLNNAPPIPNGARELEDWRTPKIEYQRRFRFTIAFENQQRDGYTSEKLADALTAGTIPIYWGNPEVGSDIDRSTFIDARDFDSLDELAEYVLLVDSDDSLARPYLERKDFLAKPLEVWREEVIDLDDQSPRLSQSVRAARLLTREGARRARRRVLRGVRGARDFRVRRHPATRAARSR
jgi:hypothetical protein